jgi:16S rRNA processing protein RimM
MKRLQIGTVARAHGVRGWVRVRVESDALLELDRVFVGDPGDAAHAGAARAIEDAQPERGDVLLKLAGVDDREAADALRGQPLYADRDALPAPADDELYVADLIGCRVVDAAGRELGRVASTFHSGAHEILVVQGGAREVLIPLVAPIVTRVDLAGGRIECDPPEGLID